MLAVTNKAGCFGDLVERFSKGNFLGVKRFPNQAVRAKEFRLCAHATRIIASAMDDQTSRMIKIVTWRHQDEGYLRAENMQKALRQIGPQYMKESM